MTWADVADFALKVLAGGLIGCAVGCLILGATLIVRVVRAKLEPRRPDDDPWDEYVDGAMGDYPRVPDDHEPGR